MSNLSEHFSSIYGGSKTVNVIVNKKRRKFGFGFQYKDGASIIYYVKSICGGHPRSAGIMFEGCNAVIKILSSMLNCLPFLHINN